MVFWSPKMFRVAQLAQEVPAFAWERTPKNLPAAGMVAAPELGIAGIWG